MVLIERSFTSNSRSVNPDDKQYLQSEAVEAEGVFATQTRW
jgi:hypothetical protein